MNSPGIRLREHVIADMEPFCELQMDPEVGRHVSWLPRTRPQCATALLDAIAQQAAEPRIRHFFAVELLATAEMIGSVGYTRTDALGADCGWFLRRPFWGHGHASEAVRQMVSLALADGRIACLTASCRQQNVASIRVAENCGFQRTGQTPERLHFEVRRPATAPAGAWPVAGLA